MVSLKDKKITEFNPMETNEDYRCGNSLFSDDVWDFKGFINAPHWNNAKFQFDFTSFNQWDTIKNTIKLYIASELLSVGFNSVKRKNAALVQLRKFLVSREDIMSFRDFSPETLRSYFDYLLNAKSERNSMPLNGQSIKKSAQVVKEILIRGSIKGWEVAENTKLVESLYNRMIINNQRIKGETKFGKSKKILPDVDIVNKIIHLAREETDVLTGASIILSSQLGLRISEVLSLKRGCLSVISGEYQIEYTTSKTTKEHINVFKPANQFVVEAVRKLEDSTKTLREQSRLPFLFLVKQNGKIGLASFSNWSKNRINPFVKRNNILNSKGELLKLSHHYFRHIFATYALKKGMKVYEVAEMMNHKSIHMTETYSHLNDELQKMVISVLSGETPVSSTNKAVLNIIDSHENPFKGKTTDQVEKMRRAMKIEILPHGLCLHHPLRGEPCAQDGVCLGCNNFLAPSTMLDHYESRLKRVNLELDKLPKDNNIYTTKLSYQAGKLDYYIKDIKIKLSLREQQELEGH